MTPKTMTDIFATAFRLHTLGYSVIPSGGGDKGKSPTVNWAEYQQRRPTHEELQAWQDNQTPELWGIVTGAISGVVVVDADSAEAREMLESCHLVPHILTPRVGGHYYFRHPGYPVKTCASLLPSIDIRGDGGFVNALGSSKVGEYKVQFLPSPDNLYPWADLPAPIAEALKNGRHQATGAGQAETQQIPQGERNSKLTKIAGGLRSKGLPQSAIEAALLAINQHSCNPPLPEKEVKTISASVARYEPVVTYSDSNTGITNTITNMHSDLGEIGVKRDEFATTSGQNDGIQWGVYARQFDEIVFGAGGPIDKREVAETIGLKVSSDTFRKLLSRRKAEGKVRAYRGSPNLIQWVRRDYQVTNLKQGQSTPLLDIRVALDIQRYASIPQGSIMVVAGMTSAGKTSFLLETAELNVFTEPRPVYYWYNEMSEGKMRLRCEDFPLLREAQAEGKFFPVRQGDFEFPDVIMPDALNLVDYVDRDDALYLIGEDIRKLYQALNTGFICVAIQKKPHVDLGYGGGMSIKLANNYITLDVIKQESKMMRGRATIKKAKDWAGDTNPNGLSCVYRSGGKHGRLFLEEEWGRKRE